MANWFYAQNGQQYGPVPDDNIRALIAQGTVRPTDLVWKDGMANWLPAQNVPELSSFAPRQPYAPPMQQGQPPVGYYNPQAGMAPGGAPPPNYLVQSILVTVCCCLPFGIVAIISAAAVNGKYQQGDYAGALEKSEAAKKWCWVALVCGLIGQVIGIGLQIAIIAAEQ